MSSKKLWCENAVIVRGSNEYFSRINKIYFCVSCENVSTTPHSRKLVFSRTWETKLFNLFNGANNNINQTLKLKRKLDRCLELISVHYRRNPCIFSWFLSLSSSSSLKYDILVWACPCLSKTLANKETDDGQISYFSS